MNAIPGPDDFKLTEKQLEAQDILAGQATHYLFLGGSRSGKTFFIVRSIIIRALKASGSRHAMLRYRFNAIKSAIWYDTFPKVLDLCFPGLKAKCKFNKSDWFVTLPNGSEIWFGGLDEKERTEKILGQEYATIFLNECSQISRNSVELVLTRLAQNVGLKLKMIYDENPPLKTHWTHRLWIEKRSAEKPYKSLPDPENYEYLFMNPKDNKENIPAEYMKILENLSPRQRARFFEGKFGDTNEHTLWSYENITLNRVKSYPDLQRVVVAVDPSGTKGEDENKRSDEIGIIVVGLGIDGHAYVLEDASCNAKPSTWGRIVCQAYDRYDADAVIGEINFGGAMVEDVIRSAASALEMSVNYREVTATRGKVVRAEPISAIYEENKVHHVGELHDLEDQLTSFTTMGYMGDGSPDRADALVWALTDLFPRVAKRTAKVKTVQFIGSGGHSVHGH